MIGFDGLTIAVLSGSSQQIVPICISGNAELGRCFFGSVEKNAFQGRFTDAAFENRFVDNHFVIDRSLRFETHVDCRHLFAGMDTLAVFLLFLPQMRVRVRMFHSHTVNPLALDPPKMRL